MENIFFFVLGSAFARLYLLIYEPVLCMNHKWETHQKILQQRRLLSAITGSVGIKRVELTENVRSFPRTKRSVRNNELSAQCHSCLVHLINNASYASLWTFIRYGTWKRTCEWQNHRFMSNKNVSRAYVASHAGVFRGAKTPAWEARAYEALFKCYKHEKWTLKNCQANRFSKSTIAIGFKFSLSTRASFCLCCFIHTFF